jgi:hypothetical protein
MAEENQKTTGESAVPLDKIVMLQNVTTTQCSDGNWNYDSYMHGLANGLIVALAIIEGREPNFLNAPKVWLKDIPNMAKPIQVELI